VNRKIKHQDIEPMYNANPEIQKAEEARKSSDEPVVVSDSNLEASAN
jgi:AGCS family alanine or glycine:cation symporter